MDIMHLLGDFGTKLAPFVAILWSIDQLLKLVAPLTPWKLDDNLSDILGKFLSSFFPKK
jgi:hypothetical protein